MGKAILIILLSSVLLFSIVSLNTNKVLEQATSKTVEHHNQRRVRNIANSMVQMVLSDLSEDDSYRVNSPQTKDLLGGTVTYTVKDKNFAGEDLIQITAESEYFGTTKKVVAYTKKVNTIEELPPPFLQYAVASDMDMTLNNSWVRDYNNPTENADVHTNGKISVDNVGAGIEGFATYVNTASGVLGNIIPNSNPDGDPPHYQVPPVDLPHFDPADWIDKADVVYPGNMNFNGPITLGTKNNPKIIYVEGAANLNPGTVVTGYGVLVVGANTKVFGGVTTVPADPLYSSFAIYGVGKVEVDGATEFYGQVYTLDAARLGGTANFYGAVVAKGKVQIAGGGDLYYRPVGSNLTSPFWEGEEGSGSGGRMTALYYNE